MTPDRVLRLRAPGDKSITHRALILAALARRGRIRAPLDAADTRSTASALRALGVSVDDLSAGDVRVHGPDAPGWRTPGQALDCGNSGTTARLLLGALAAQPVQATLTGDASLRRRPMRRVIDPLLRMGARIRELEQPDQLPLQVTGGPLSALTHDNVHLSAQVKSALLLAGLVGRVRVEVHEARRTRDHTERLLRALGMPVRTEPGPQGWSVILEETSEALQDVTVEVPGDFSAAAFLLGAALLRGRGEVRIENVGVNPTRTGLLAVLARMGAHVEVQAQREVSGEDVADLALRAGPLRGTHVEADEVPALIDEIPVIAVLAARAEGETRIRGAGELRVKESDRIAALVSNLRAIGADAEEQPDGLVIAGGAGPLQGRVEACGDHRIAMAFGMLAADPRCRVTVDRPEVAAVSFPAFPTLLARVVAE